MIHMFYDREGRPVTTEQWGELRAYRAYEYEQVGLTDLIDVASGTYVTVSTVWLGIDHSFGFGEPLIFESMIFSNAGEIISCLRYPTEAAAEAGHDEVVAAMRATLVDPIVVDRWGWYVAPAREDLARWEDDGGPIPSHL